MSEKPKAPKGLSHKLTKLISGMTTVPMERALRNLVHVVVKSHGFKNVISVDGENMRVGPKRFHLRFPASFGITAAQLSAGTFGMKKLPAWMNKGIREGLEEGAHALTDQHEEAQMAQRKKPQGNEEEQNVRGPAVFIIGSGDTAVAHSRDCIDPAVARIPKEQKHLRSLEFAQSIGVTLATDCKYCKPFFKANAKEEKVAVHEKSEPDSGAVILGRMSRGTPEEHWAADVVSVFFHRWTQLCKFAKNPTAARFEVARLRRKVNHVEEVFLIANTIIQNTDGSIDIWGTFEARKDIVRDIMDPKTVGGEIRHAVSETVHTVGSLFGRGQKGAPKEESASIKTWRAELDERDRRDREERRNPTFRRSPLRFLMRKLFGQ